MAKLLTGNNPESQGNVQEMKQTLRTVKELFEKKSRSRVASNYQVLIYAGLFPD